MGGKISKNEYTYLASLKDFCNYYNYYSFPCRLYGKTPMQIVYGETIDKKLYTEILQQAKVNRVLINQNFNQCIFTLGCNVSSCSKVYFSW